MKMHEATIQILKAVPYLASLNPTALATIASHCRPKSLRGEQILFMEGDLCQHLYILESGWVKCYRSSVEGREQVLKVFDRPGDTFCISSAFSTGRYVVTARAMSETRLHLLDVVTVSRLAGEHPSVALKLVTLAGEHMKSLVDLADDLSLKTATARLAKLLYELAAVEGVQNDKEIHLRRDSLREERLASMIGTVRVHVSRILKNLVRAGAIRLDREMIRIPDLKVLEQLS